MIIKKVCFNDGWINNKHKEIHADPILIEKAIYAFELLGCLVENGVNLIFKGGTGLMLLVPELKRLSIDIDIITEDKDEVLEKVFNTITKDRIFKRWEEDKRHTSHKIPKRHFKFYYASLIEKRNSYVLLDIIQINSPFPKTIEKPIVLPLFVVEKEVRVIMPTVNSFTGDKLSAFAPTSIGIPYGKGKSMEIIKQLFDLGILFEHINDIKEISNTYKKIAKLESSYRNITLPTVKFLSDSINTSFLLCQLDFRGSIENDYTRELRDGIRKIKSHIVGGRYSLLNAKEDASKVAFIAYLIKNNHLDIDMRQLKQNKEDINRIKDTYLPEEFGILNKLKVISPESFNLWTIVTKVKNLV